MHHVTFRWNVIIHRTFIDGLIIFLTSFGSFEEIFCASMLKTCYSLSGVNVLNGMLGNTHEVSFIFSGLNNVNTADTRPTGGSLHSGTSPCCRCCLHCCSIYTRDTTAPRCLSLSVFQLTYPHIFVTEKPALHIQPVCRSFILKTTLRSLENNLH